jgi:ketosteroid isomerase-like protein
MTHREITDDDLAKLVERVREATGALMQGDIHRYLGLVNHAPDFTLMPPTGGPARHGFDSSPASVEALEKTFAGGGDGDLELVQQYASGDLAVLVGVERQHGPVAGLPDQDWPFPRRWSSGARTPTGDWCTDALMRWCIRSPWSSSSFSPAAPSSQPTWHSWGRTLARSAAELCSGAPLEIESRPP